MIPERHQREDRPAVAKDSGRKAVSRVYGKLHPFTVSGISKTGLYVLGRQVRKIQQNLLLRHAGRQVFEDVVHGNPHAAYAGLATAFSRFNGDNVPIIHGATSRVIAARRLYTTAAKGSTLVALDARLPVFHLRRSCGCTRTKVIE